jgi:hypothetical protein
MAVTKENSYGEKNPLFLRFVNKKIGITEILQSFSLSKDPKTAAAAIKALENPPDLENFRKELEEAVRDLAKEGLGEEFKVFVNHYMESSITQINDTEKTPFGENKMFMAYIKDENSTWVEGFICYNLCLYIKVFGLDNLKSCRTCGTLFCHKGKWAVYCEDTCNPKKR